MKKFLIVLFVNLSQEEEVEGEEEEEGEIDKVG